MRDIIIKEQEGKLVLRTPELDGYMYLNYENGKADTSRLEDNSCQNTFACSAKELRQLLKEEGY